MLSKDRVEDTRLEAKDTKKLRGQGQGHKRKCSLKKKVFKIFFQTPQKKVFKNFFPGDLHLRKTKKGLRKFSSRFLAFSNKISTVQKILLSSSRGQGSFRGLVASRPTPRTSKCVLENSTSDAEGC